MSKRQFLPWQIAVALIVLFLGGCLCAGASPAERPSTELATPIPPGPSAVDPSNKPFLMKIDTMSMIRGRGLLLEGIVVQGTLQAGGNVEILGPQNVRLTPVVTLVETSGTEAGQVTAGDYAGILINMVLETDVSPGMLLVEAGAFESYEAALQILP